MVNFLPAMTCWVSNMMYSSWGIQWWPQKKSFELYQNKTIKLKSPQTPKISQFGKFWAYHDMFLLGMKN